MVERFTVKGWNDEQIALAAEDGKWVLYEEHEDAVAALAEANKALNYLNDAVAVGLPDQEISRRAQLLVSARRALTGGQEDG